MINRIAVLILLLTASFGLMAQDHIVFTASLPETRGIGMKQKYEIKLKVGEVLARNKVGSISVYNPFVVQPELILTGKSTTEGVVRDITVVTGEFSFVVKNRYDGTVYGTVILEVSGDASEGDDVAFAEMINSIKVNSPVFMRLLRYSSQKIAEHYKEGCAVIVEKAQEMMQAEQFEEVIAYLSAIPRAASCYEQGTILSADASARIKAINCDDKLREARDKYKQGEYQEALELLGRIAVSSTCGEAAASLTDTITRCIVFPQEADGSAERCNQ